jgi:glycosyltransferase involved in cell wall biosynthesis
MVGTRTRVGLDHWPSVSVVVPTYRRPELLRAAVQSVLTQRYPGHIECLVVFDREDPVMPVEAIPERRSVVLLRNDRAPGPSGGYNVGALAATGDYFAWLDDDDEWLPDKTRLEIEALRRHPEARFAICGVVMEDGRRSARPRRRVPKQEVLRMPETLAASRNELHSSTFLVDREFALREIGLIDEDIPHSYGEDYDWLLRAARVTPLVAVRQPLVRIRWQYSYFAQSWAKTIEGLRYQLGRMPELSERPRNLARIYGRMAFAHAAVGDRREARAWARRSLALDRQQPRGYLAYLVSYGLVRPGTVQRLAYRVGRGI